MAEFCSKMDSKEALTTFQMYQLQLKLLGPVYQSGLVAAAGKGGAEWFISFQVNQLSISKRFIPRKFESNSIPLLFTPKCNFATEQTSQSVIFSPLALSSSKCKLFTPKCNTLCEKHKAFSSRTNKLTNVTSSTYKFRAESSSSSDKWKFSNPLKFGVSSHSGRILMEIFNTFHSSTITCNLQTINSCS